MVYKNFEVGNDNDQQTNNINFSKYPDLPNFHEIRENLQKLLISEFNLNVFEGSYRFVESQKQKLDMMIVCKKHDVRAQNNDRIEEFRNRNFEIELLGQCLEVETIIF